MFVDSHAHLNYLDNPDEKILAARKAGVSGFLCIGVDGAGRQEVLEIAQRHDDVWASLGVHPDAAHEDLAWLPQAVNHPKVVAVGETGLDYFRDNDPTKMRQQKQAFDIQLALAGDMKLPVVVHTRAAADDTISLMRAHAGTTGVMHCFTETWAMAKLALDLGYYVSMSGIVTFKNAEQVREVASKVPIERLLIETDSPYLAPVPHRGKTNEPSFVINTATFIAQLRNMDVVELAEKTTNNFFRLFNKASFPNKTAK